MSRVEVVRSAIAALGGLKVADRRTVEGLIAHAIRETEKQLAQLHKMRRGLKHNDAGKRAPVIELASFRAQRGASRV